MLLEQCVFTLRVDTLSLEAPALIQTVQAYVCVYWNLWLNLKIMSGILLGQ